MEVLVGETPMRTAVFAAVFAEVFGCLLGCNGGAISTDAADASDAASSDLPASYQDLAPFEARPTFDVDPDGGPAFLGLWTYGMGTNHLACDSQDASDDPSTGQLFISPAATGLDVEDAGCHIHFSIDASVAAADPPMQACGSNTAPANWTLTLQDDGTLKEDVVGSIVVANVSCFIQGTSILARQMATSPTSSD
jgi:hypothetical protein